MAKQYDVIVIGAGLVGLATAYQIKLKAPNKKVLIIEKSVGVATHQSGNNSGVIHSGVYYRPGSLKAKNCIEGYNHLLNFAKAYNIPFDLCGKLIVATSLQEEHLLKGIYKNGIANGLAGLKILSQTEMLEKEPHVVGSAAIYVPQTGIIDYIKMAEKLLELFTQQFGGEALFLEEVTSISQDEKDSIVVTTRGSYKTNFLITCAGLQSDRVAALTGGKRALRILPFRGEYYKLKSEKEYLVKNLIYPVPDPEFPFLGVHFTRMINGGVEAGPNAVLSFKREGYVSSSFNLRDSLDIVTWPGFWKIVGKYGKTGMAEMYRSFSKKAFTHALQKLVPEIQEKDLVRGGAGVRAQACDRKGILIDDFNIVQNKKVIHVLNAPSPAATSCLAIGKSLSEKVL